MKIINENEPLKNLADALELKPFESEALLKSLREIITLTVGNIVESKAEQPIINEKNAREFIDDFLRSIPPYPENKFRGKGIVICAGGLRMFRCAWVCLNFLRRFGCKLPVEMWALNDTELTEKMKALASPLDVQFVNADFVRREYPARILNAWELKPFAILNSQFEEVILLDADNMPLVNAETLFSFPAYEQTGSLFWPDAERFAPNDPIWRICNLDYRDEPQFESGQIVINKKVCWHPLQLTKHLNDHSDFYYRYVHGDKDTFHLAWRILQKNYGMTPYPMTPLSGAMCQHDFNGHRIFQHRNFLKWDADSGSIDGFLYERDCLTLLNVLDQQISSD